MRSQAATLIRLRPQPVIRFRSPDCNTDDRPRSNLRVHHLIECARRAGLDADGRLSAVVTEMMGEAEAASALVAAGVLDESEMRRLRALQTADVLRPFLLWTDGDWSFDPRARSTEQPVHLDIKQLLLEGAQHLPAGFAAARLTGYDKTISPTGGPPPPGLHLQPVEGYVLSRVDMPLKLGELIAVAGLPEPQTRHAVYALALCGLLARERWPVALAGAAAGVGDAAAADAATPAAAREQGEPVAAPQPEKPRPAPEADPRAELEALLERVAGEVDYFQILGVGRAARPADIKRAYYALAKRFHPDRFRQVVADEGERTRVEHAFAQVLKAYETLHDPRARDTYATKFPAKSPARAPSLFGKRKEAGGAKVGAREAAPDAAKTQADPTATPQYRAEESFQQGLSAAERGDHAAAQAYFGEAVRLAPQEARYHALYGRALALAPATRRQAESELQRAIKLDPRNVTYYVALADLYRAVGLRRRAEGELSRALALDPNHEPARRMLEQLKGSES
ncbi:MAG: DnaJ domain-containing protein [Acidobacteria bacterium]|nr:DnaJ domain-containing protein [Acidobacteriota bacterium]